MTVSEILNEMPITIAEIKSKNEKIKKRDVELGFRTSRTEEYLNHFVLKDSLKLQETLKKLDIARLKDEQIVKIADLMPKTVDDLKVILQAYTVTITKENMKKIIDEVLKVSA